MQRSISFDYRERLLPLLLILVGAGIITIALAANLLGISSQSSFSASQVSLALSGLVIMLAGIVQALSAERRYIGEWLLIGVGAIVVAFAADLLSVGNLPAFGIKQIMMISIALAVALIGVAPASDANQNYLSAWLKLLIINKESAAKFLGVVIQLGLLVLVVRQYELENQAFSHRILPLAFYGYIIHYFLPLRYRLPFFMLLSLAAILGIFGLSSGLWLIGTGLGLIAICHLPLHFSMRMVILLIAGAALAVLRTEWFVSPWPGVIWPILGSMFMFRLIIYIYDLKHGKESPTVSSTLSYFFLFPNLVFPFFPVVDYSTFRRTYYNDDRYRIYQKGLDWMFRGVVHLILYRAVNYYMVIAPEDVTNTSDLIRFMVSNFALYLRVSGQFHLIIGLLHLFGFNLPETHHLYFLASNFVDLWRRINIYWKDFMLKVFYYPTYFRIRHWGPTTSLIVATSFVFLATWFFHAYQWFWLRGTFLLTPQDVLFWFLLALLVIGNTLYEAKRGRKRTLGKRSRTFADVAVLALQTAGTFTLMIILWSLWTSDSISDWLSLLSVVEMTGGDMAGIIIFFLSIVVVFGAVIWLEEGARNFSGISSKQSTFIRSATVIGTLILMVYLIGNPVVYGQISGKPQELISDLTVARLSDRDAALPAKGLL